MAEERSPASARLLTGVAWALLFLGIWAWGKELTDEGAGGTAARDAATSARRMGIELPPAHKPLPPARPHRVDIPSINVQAPVVRRGLDAQGAVAPPPYDQRGVVGWYRGGTTPGAKGTALFVGHVDTKTDPAVFYDLSALRPGEKVRVTRADGTLAEFTVEDVRVFGRDDFDAAQVYGERQPGRAELRLITCGGTFDRATRSYEANVVVSAYLTGKGS